jgi:uncharacterized protein YndB with AHSA1/START domain
VNGQRDETFTLHMERTFAAPREEVYRAWTEPSALAAWWWPWSPSVEIDPRPGGRYRFAADHPHAGRLVVFGEFVDVVPLERLVYTFAWEDEGDDLTVVTVEFHARGDETEVVLTQTGFTTAENRDNHGLGWHDCLDRLAELTSRQSVAV